MVGGSGSQEREVRKGFRVTGRVQGVGFRWWTQKTASTLGLRGTVRNCQDGSVEVEAEGPTDSMATFEQKLQHGPSSARVDDVTEVEAPGELPGDFRIRR